ncbi:response regulator transcription factor [Streptomyces sp. NPDC055059]
MAVRPDRLIDKGRVAALDTPSGLIRRSAGSTVISFTPSAPLDEGDLNALPALASAERKDGRITLSGTDETVNAVITLLARGHIIAHQLRATAAQGRTVLSPAVASRLVSTVRCPGAPGNEPLSTREREVLALVVKGTSNREIVRVLFISESTVKTHLTHPYTKLGVKDRAAAVAVAYDRGILG